MLIMKFSKLSVGLLVAALSLSAMATPGTKSAKALLGDASAKALREKKNVLVLFHASWCGWCKKLDAMLESPTFKKTFENSYVITHVVVLENGPQKSLENAGGEDLMYSLGATKTSGIPFFAVLSPQGTKLGDSNLPNKQNMGYPSEPDEVAAFMDLLKRTAPRMTDSDRATVETFLKTKSTAAHG